jgi:hypothetical protein
MLKSYKEFVHVLCAPYVYNESLMGRSCVCPSAWFGIRTIKQISVTFGIGQGGRSSTLKLWSYISVGPLQSNASFTLHEVKKILSNFSIVLRALANHIHCQSCCTHLIKYNLTNAFLLSPISSSDYFCCSTLHILNAYFCHKELCTKWIRKTKYTFLFCSL